LNKSLPENSAKSDKFFHTTIAAIVIIILILKCREISLISQKQQGSSLAPTALPAFPGAIKS